MRVVILGGNIAGSNAADVIKKENPKIDVEIYSEEPYFNYARTKLPAFICGKCGADELVICNENWYKERNIKFNRNYRAIEIIPDQKIVRFENKKETTYDKLLLAIGSVSSVLPVKGIDKEGIFTLKTLDDAKKIIENAKNKNSAIVIGGGLLGLETAKGLRDLKLEVTVCEVFQRLLPRQLDIEGAEILQKILENFGIKVVLGATTKEITSNGELKIILADGRQASADMIVLSVGVKPNIELAKKAGINVNRGIIVDKYMQTNISNVYAAGDCAEYNGRVWGIIPPAFEQSKIAALNIIGKKVEYIDIVPSNTLKIVEVDLTSIGAVTPEDLKDKKINEIRMVDKENGIYKKIVIQDNKVIGAILLGDRTNQSTIMKIIKNKIDVSKFKEKILNNDFDLKKYISGS